MKCLQRSKSSAAVLANRAGKAGRAFTLTELLVAVGALALLSIAVAQVFSLTSRTVAAGRRQSAINAAAAAMERQIRADFAQITRDGFLVIRNQVSSLGDPNENGDLRQSVIFPVPLSPNDPAPRPRRVDELLFFAKGNFASKREPGELGQVVKSDTAMIYYGHGTGQLPGIDGINPAAPSGSGWNTPVNRADPNPISDGTGQVVAPPLGWPIPFSPQRYASDWTLARLEVVLSGQGGPGLPRVETAFGDAINRLRLLSSGVVDIAGTSLSAIRSWVMRADGMNTTTFYPYSDFAHLNAQKMTIQTEANPIPSSFNLALLQMQVRMLGALPKYHSFAFPEPFFNFDSPFVRSIYSFDRPRVEKTAPNLIGWEWLNGRATEQQRADQIMLSSKAFLPRCSEFIVEWSFGLEEKGEPPRRTQFDRFLSTANPPAPAPGKGPPGLTAPNSLIWHGLPRDVRRTGNAPLSVVRPYRAYYDYNLYGQPFSRPLPPTSDRPFWDALRDARYYSVPVKLRNGREREIPHIVRPELIEFDDAPTGGRGYPNVYHAVFGYIDPNWSPETRLRDRDRTTPDGQPVLSYDADNDGKYDADQGDVKAVELVRDVRGDGEYNPDEGDQIILNEPTTVPWAWPKLIRITFSIADPGTGDAPPIEQTFQVILRVPDEEPKVGF
ncbi:MAG: type II secretion system protein J [bacterium]